MWATSRSPVSSGREMRSELRIAACPARTDAATRDRSCPPLPAGNSLPARPSPPAADRVTLSPADWEAFELPIRIRSNASVLVHSADDSGINVRPRTLDWGAAQNLIVVEEGATLALDDLISTNPGNFTLGDTTMVLKNNGARATRRAASVGAARERLSIYCQWACRCWGWSWKRARLDVPWLCCPHPCLRPPVQAPSSGPPSSRSTTRPSSSATRPSSTTTRAAPPRPWRCGGRTGRRRQGESCWRAGMLRTRLQGRLLRPPAGVLLQARNALPAHAPPPRLPAAPAPSPARPPWAA